MAYNITNKTILEKENELLRLRLQKKDEEIKSCKRMCAQKNTTIQQMKIQIRMLRAILANCRSRNRRPTLPAPSAPTTPRTTLGPPPPAPPLPQAPPPAIVARNNRRNKGKPLKYY